jgi:hypothetical protein
LCFIIKLLDSWPEGVWWDIHSVSRNCRDHGGDEGWQKLRYRGGDTEAPEAEGKAELSPRVKRNRAARLMELKALEISTWRSRTSSL